MYTDNSPKLQHSSNIFFMWSIEEIRNVLLIHCVLIGTEPISLIPLGQILSLNEYNNKFYEWHTIYSIWNMGTHLYNNVIKNEWKVSENCVFSVFKNKHKNYQYFCSHYSKDKIKKNSDW